MEGAWELDEVIQLVVFGRFHYLLAYSGSNIGERCVIDRFSLIWGLARLFYEFPGCPLSNRFEKVLSYSYGIEF
jgi:hypothetical protein